MSEQLPRTIGPVTGVVGATTAGVVVACWLIRTLTGFDIPADVQGMVTIVLVFVAGWCVSPNQALARARAELHGDTDAAR